MAFTDRIVEYPGRVQLTNVSGDVYDMVRAEGEVYDEGTLLNANNMNYEIPRFALDETAAPGTVDGDLYAAIVALGWDSEVIE